MLIKFTDIPDRLKYPPAVKGVLSSHHSSIVLYAARNFRSTKKFRRQVINTMNTITYHIVNGEETPAGWSESNPLLDDDKLVDEFEAKEQLKSLFIDEADVDWDVEEAEYEASATVLKPKSTTVNFPPDIPVQLHRVGQPDVLTTFAEIPAVIANSEKPKRVCNIEDLSIQPPQYPQMDFSTPWFKGNYMGVEYAIYPSLPAIPTKQREISITTDVSIIPEAALLDLYPAEVMQTRGSDMYQPVEGLKFDPRLGVLLQVDGFTEAQVIDNIIRYPHLYNIRRVVDGKQIAFHKMIEIDGQLVNTGDVWDTLDDTNYLPKSTSFVKEYVIRRYLLERDVKGVDHISKIFGDLSPFLTLFMPSDAYSEFGYSDSADIARQCVTARVKYKQSRSPVLRRFTDE